MNTKRDILKYLGLEFWDELLIYMLPNLDGRWYAEREISAIIYFDEN